MTTAPASLATSASEALIGREVASPIGVLTLLAEGDAIVGLYFEGHRPSPRAHTDRRGPSAALDAAEAELAMYFRDPTHGFRVPLSPRGTAIERAVWDQLREIPCGRTNTYGAIATAIGRPKAARAVGRAVAHNPLSLLVPCHRVVGASGALTGFAGGLTRKAWLLAHEAQSAAGGIAVTSPY